MNNVHFNVITGSPFSGVNLANVEAVAKENGYKSKRWISFGNIKSLDAFGGASLRGKGARCITFPDGKRVPYSVFNVEEVPSLELKGLKTKASKAPKKAAKAAPKKASKASRKPVKAVKDETSGLIAIPVQGQPGEFIIQSADGTFTQVTLS